MKSSPPRPGFEAVRIPGERSLALREANLADGVPVAASLFAKLQKVAADKAVAPLTALG